jgi:hypothetical protein
MPRLCATISLARCRLNPSASNSVSAHFQSTDVATIRISLAWVLQQRIAPELTATIWRRLKLSQRVS